MSKTNERLLDERDKEIERLKGMLSEAERLTDKYEDGLRKIAECPHEHYSTYLCSAAQEGLENE